MPSFALGILRDAEGEVGMTGFFKSSQSDEYQYLTQINQTDSPNSKLGSNQHVLMQNLWLFAILK